MYGARNTSNMDAQTKLDNLSHMKPIKTQILTVSLFAAAVAIAGCRAHPVSLAITLIGDVVDDRDVKEREDALIGHPPSAADTMFGKRHDTLIDVAGNHQWIIYPEPGESLAESFYVVVTRDDIITELFKCKRNIDGLEDLEHTREIENEAFGKSPEQCEAALRFEPPLLIMRSQASNVIARFYGARNWTHTRQARYCLLVFDQENRCQEVRMIGVTATTHHTPTEP